MWPPNNIPSTIVLASLLKIYLTLGKASKDQAKNQISPNFKLCKPALPGMEHGRN